MSEDKLLNDRYLLKGTLGRGGMAMVYLAEDRMLERQVAVKVLKSEYARDPAFRERFRQEAKAAANLSHPNIVQVYDFGYYEKRLYIVMEYIPGRDLYTTIQEKGRFSTEMGLDLSIKACKGIGYAHRAGLVHCDVKPHNLLVTPDMQLKVTDFGIARALASIDPGEENRVVWGSPQYFSPEQAYGEPPSPASDVYSIGVVMYQMFTGQLPFLGKNSRELARMHRMAEPISPCELNPFLPPQLEEVILKVLSKEPSARYRTADQLGRVLQMIYERHKSTTAGNVEASPGKATRAATPESRTHQIGDPTLSPEEDAMTTNIDWLTVVLGMVALTAWGGLIPFFYWVFHRIR